MPDGRLIAGLEQPLYADLPARLRNGRPFSGGRGDVDVSVELVRASDTWQPRREWVYPLDATRARGLYTGICNDGENGLTDLLALDDTRLLALERACLQRPDTGAVRNTVRIFLVDLVAADDCLPISGLKAASARPVPQDVPHRLRCAHPAVAAGAGERSTTSRRSPSVRPRPAVTARCW